MAAMSNGEASIETLSSKRRVILRYAPSFEYQNKYKYGLAEDVEVSYSGICLNFLCFFFSSSLITFVHILCVVFCGIILQCLIDRLREIFRLLARAISVRATVVSLARQRVPRCRVERTPRCSKQTRIATFTFCTSFRRRTGSNRRRCRLYLCSTDRARCKDQR